MQRHHRKIGTLRACAVSRLAFGLFSALIIEIEVG